MQNKEIHIVCFDNPYPPNYGGVIDVFYKIKAMHSIGFEIVLHCFFDDNNKISTELQSVTKTIFLYKKSKNLLLFFSAIPFSVRSRSHKSLIRNLQKDKYPILFEGLQSTMVLKDLGFSDREIILRLHNIESNYYGGMSKSQTNWIKKIAFKIESIKYQNYQKIISNFDYVFTLSNFENNWVQKHFGNSIFIPVFHGNKEVLDRTGFGEFAMYHGDLRLSDNKKAVLFLISIFKVIKDYKLVIASSTGEKFVEANIKNLNNISFQKIQNPTDLDKLLLQTHLNVMVSFQESGTKLKLVHSLYNSRFCIINDNIVDDERLKSLCVVANSKVDFINAIKIFRSKKFDDFANRKNILDEVLDVCKNAKIIEKTILNSFKSIQNT